MIYSRVFEEDSCTLAVYGSDAFVLHFLLSRYKSQIFEAEISPHQFSSRLILITLVPVAAVRNLAVLPEPERQQAYQQIDTYT